MLSKWRYIMILFFYYNNLASKQVGLISIYTDKNVSCLWRLGTLASFKSFLKALHKPLIGWLMKCYNLYNPLWNFVSYDLTMLNMCRTCMYKEFHFACKMCEWLLSIATFLLELCTGSMNNADFLLYVFNGSV